MKSKLPNNVVNIMRLINKQNKESYIIGSAVRELIMYNKAYDFDLYTNLSLCKLQEQIPNINIIKTNEGKKAGIIKENDCIIKIYELCTERLEEEMIKKDFTIEGIAMDEEGNIIDLYNFQKDIYNKKVSLIDQTGTSLKIEPALILKALRLSCQLDFEIDEKTKELIFQNKLSTTKTIESNNFTEISEMITKDKFPDIFEEYFNVFLMIIPEIINVKLDDYIKRKMLLTIIPDNLILKLAALFTYNTDNNRDFQQFANRMKLDRKTTRLVLKLLSYKDREISNSDEDINNIIKEFNIQSVDLLFAYKKAVMIADNECIKNLEEIKNIFQAKINELTKFKISNIQVNLEKIVSMGYSQEESNIIFDDIRRRILTESLQNNPQSIRSYVLSNYKRS